MLRKAGYALLNAVLAAAHYVLSRIVVLILRVMARFAKGRRPVVAKGEVKWFDNEEGYGFIAVKDRDDDVFVHHSDIHVDGYATLSEGQRVSFQLTYTEKGSKAVNVVLMEEDET